MRILLFISICFFISNFEILSQNNFTAKITDHDNHEPLIGVNVVIEGTQLGAASDFDGKVNIKNIPDGIYEIKFSFIGYKDEMIDVAFPENNNEIFEIEMESDSEELEEISVTSTRGSRLIEDVPTRVEVIAGEEIDEKISMDPSNLSMLLNESTGIQVQQTSAASVNNSFRIQGLDGKYTQLLKDGFPLYAGFSGGLSIVQIPPLDLTQIEIIKGSSSTLYGGGAIAGLINLVSIKPSDKRDISFLINGTSAGGLDLSGFYSQKYDDFGLSLFASRNTQKAYDNNNDQFSDLPQIERYNFNPKLYFYFDESNTLEIGANYTYEDRLGGGIPAIENGFDSVYSYTENNLSSRFSTLARYDLKINDNKKFTVKNSFSYFNRELSLTDYIFKGEQYSSFSEVTYLIDDEKLEWIFGANLITENFDEKDSSVYSKDFDYVTTGLFIQNLYDISDRISLESGLRVDYDRDFGIFSLPRVSLLYKINNNFTTRIGGGLGYKLPSLFNDETEQLAFRNVLPLNKEGLEPERSYGFNFDINYKTILFDKLSISFNNLFFYTRINNPLEIGFNTTEQNYKFSSIDGHYFTRGIESNLKFTLNNYKLFAGYTFTDVHTHTASGETIFPLTPKHRLGLIIIYEIHGSLRIGLEGYFTGNQQLSDGSKVNDYWITGIMIEKRISNFRFFLNFENFLDTRQSRYGAMYTGSPSNPNFVDIYAPTDGSIINGGVKISL